MSIIAKQDSNGIKPLLQVGELGYDNYPTGGDEGRVYVGTGTSNIAQAKKSEVTAVDSKVDTHVASVDNPHGVTKAQVGLGNADDTSDVDKPISTATQSALDLKANADNAALTGIPTAPTATVGTDTTQLATTAFVKAEVANEVYSKVELDAGQLDNRYFTETELLNGALDVRYYTETEINTLDSTTVKLTENQTISGTKTFSSNIVGNITGNAGTATKLQTARTINGVAFDGSTNITISLDDTAVKLTGDQTVTGIKTFSSSPIVPTPTATNDVANKAYVDSIISSSIPKGFIGMWSGSIATIPSGWALCNGANGTPDLRDRFIVGAGSTYNVGVTGGSKDAVVVAHTHTGTAASGGGGGSFMTGFDVFSGATSGGYPNGNIINYGSTSAHTHTVSINSTGSSGTNANLPPYYALAYIMKI